MSRSNSFGTIAACLVATLLFLQIRVCGQQPEAASTAGVHGGLIVQLGARDTDWAAELSKTGRYLVHVLDHDSAVVRTAQSRLRQEGRYGLAWV